MRHFIYQPRKKPRNICDPASSNHHNSGVLHGKNNILVGSHNTNLGAVAHGALELYVFQLEGAIFFVTLAFLDISSKKSCL